MGLPWRAPQVSPNDRCPPAAEGAARVLGMSRSHAGSLPMRQRCFCLPASCASLTWQRPTLPAAVSSDPTPTVLPTANLVGGPGFNQPGVPYHSRAGDVPSASPILQLREGGVLSGPLSSRAVSNFRQDPE